MELLTKKQAIEEHIKMWTWNGESPNCYCGATSLKKNKAFSK